jgi:hypothetical protein
MLNKLKTIFIAKEPQIDIQSFKDIFELIKIQSPESICFHINLKYDLPYPFTSSVKFIELFLAEIQKKFNKKVYIIDFESKKFTALKQKFTNTSIEFVEITKENRKTISDKSFEISLPEIWIESDLRINLDTIKIHKHHFDQVYKGIIFNLINLLESSVAKKLKDNASDKDLSYLFETISKTSPFYTLTDARLVGISDEHSLFLKAKKLDKVIFSDEIKRVEREMSEELGLLLVPEYLD